MSVNHHRGKHKGKAGDALLEWQTCDNDAAWQASQAQVRAGIAAQQPSSLPRWWQKWWLVTLAMTLLLFAVGLTWVQTRQERATIEREVRSAVELDASAMDAETMDLAQMVLAQMDMEGMEAGEKLRWAVEMPVDRWGVELPPLHDFSPASASVQAAEVLDLGSGWARMRVTVNEGGDFYRQTRLYQQQDTQWVRVDPNGSQWGRPRQRESLYFLFRYYAQDEEAVWAAAPKLDALYPIFYAALMAGDPPNNKLVVEVDPAATITLENEAADTQDVPLILPSPSATLAPIEVSEEELLVQGVALALFKRLAAQSDTLNQLPEWWRYLRSGLRLWLLWDQELPLARWRDPLVRWVFGADAGVRSLSGHRVPRFAHDFCAHHRLWLSSETEIGMPVICVQDVTGGEGFLAFRYSSPPHMLPSFISREEALYREDNRDAIGPPLPHASVVMFATLFEYITLREGTAEDGTEQIGAEKEGAETESAETIRGQQVAAFVAAIPDHTNWDSLIGALYGESQRDFEAGWNAFVQERYGLAP